MFEYKTMTEIAATELRKAIMCGDLSPGTRLIPSKLEEELNLSRVAIREAIRELAGSGLVENVTNVGARVASPPSIEEIKEIFEIRLDLEPKLAVRAAKMITEQELEILQALCGEMESQPTPGKEIFFLNRNFHQAIYKISGWNFLYSVVSRFIDQILIFRSLNYPTNLDLKAINQEHRLIISRIKEGKAREIKSIITAHINRGLDDLIRITSG